LDVGVTFIIILPAGSYQKSVYYIEFLGFVFGMGMSCLWLYIITRPKIKEQFK